MEDKFAGKTEEEIAKEFLVQKPVFSEEATKFAEDAEKQAKEDVKVENLPAEQQVEFTARFFNMYFKVFQNKINGLNKKAAARVINTLIAYPLETNGKLKWTSKVEEDTFLIGNQLLETKYLMFKYVAAQEMEKAQLEQNKKESEGVKTDG